MSACVVLSFYLLLLVIGLEVLILLKKTTFDRS